MFENEPGKPEFPVLRPGLDFKDFVGPQSRVFSRVHATLQSALSVHCIGRSVGQLVGPSHTTSFMTLFL